MNRAELFLILRALKLWQYKNSEKGSENWNELDRLISKISKKILDAS